jgi:NAD(P)-dependent dehydrogenase (short-subunit alcohol dehydrogenase family)
VGQQIARRFLEEGAQILGTARDQARLEATARELDPSGQRLSVCALDLRERDAGQRLAEAAAKRFVALDVLFNNAGVQLDGSAQGLLDGEEEALEASFAINMWAPYRLCRALTPLLLQGNQPRIVNVSSGAGNLESMSSNGIAGYRLSKWALNGLTMLLAAELSGKVSVNAFDPGWVKTVMGGPSAPGSHVESAEGALAIVTAPFSETGKFWKDGQQIPF